MKPDLLAMEVFIPSRSRWQRSKTLEALRTAKRRHEGWDRNKVYLVVPEAQQRKYRRLAAQHRIAVLGCPEDGIAATRRWIGEQATDRFLMLDDDLIFNRRRDMKDPKLYPFNDTDMGHMLLYVSRMLDYFAHVSIGPRQFNNHITTEDKFPFFEVGRPLRALAYRKKEFLRCEHGRVRIMEDFDITLQLIAQGYRNCIITQYTNDQGGTQAPGGCSDYRDEELHAREVKRMHKLHPQYTTIVEKKNKTGGLRERLELRINWQKAYKLALEDILG